MKLGKYGYAWITAAFFAITFTGHCVFQWLAYVQDQAEHHQSVELKGYIIELGRDTLENWQSEFLACFWQIAGLAMLLYVGSPQSKESQEREEAKLDAILRKLDPDGAEKLITDLDRRYLR